MHNSTPTGAQCSAWPWFIIIILKISRLSLPNLNISQFGNFSYLCWNRYKLRIISKKILREFWEKHSDSQQQLKSWFQGASNVEWKSLKDIKKEYPKASILEDKRVVFNIKGNKYRLIVKINYDYQMVWIRFIGTHAEYDKIDATKI